MPSAVDDSDRSGNGIGVSDDQIEQPVRPDDMDDADGAAAENPYERHADDPDTADDANVWKRLFEDAMRESSPLG